MAELAQTRVSSRPERASPLEPPRRIPGQVWAALAATLCMLVGWNWDISWHRSIGRDTVWTPAHIAIYVALAVAFAYNAGLVLRHTFAARERDAGIRVLGFRGPSGSFVTLWSILLQFTGILFDNWWHEVYGLDNAVFSPPHFLLALAISVFYFGQFLLVAVYRNQAAEVHRGTLMWVALVLWSFFLGHQLIGMDPTFGPLAVRSQAFLVSCAVILPFSLLLIQAYLDRWWAAAAASAFYMVEVVVLMQVFQLFPASQRFGPVFQQVDFLLPPAFPILLVVPAALVGLVVHRLHERPLAACFAAGAVFVVSFTATNWLTSGFMTTSWAENAFFTGGYPGSAFQLDYRPTRPLDWSSTSALLAALSLVLAGVSALVGRAGGRWLRGVVR